MAPSATATAAEKAPKMIQLFGFNVGVPSFVGWDGWWMRRVVIVAAESHLLERVKVDSFTHCNALGLTAIAFCESAKSA